MVFIRYFVEDQVLFMARTAQIRKEKGQSIITLRLCESDLHGQIAAKTPLLKDSSKKKRLAWVKKPEQWTLDQWKSVLWSDESKCEIFGLNRRVFVRRRVGEQMSSACVVPTVKHGGGEVIVWG